MVFSAGNVQRAAIEFRAATVRGRRPPRNRAFPSSAAIDFNFFGVRRASENKTLAQHAHVVVVGDGATLATQRPIARESRGTRSLV